MVDSATSTVEWQSAFWGIVTIALNTIVQPAGSVCYLPPKYGLLLRSSPFLCLTDTVTVIYDIAKNAKHMSLRKAIRAVAESRHRDDTEHDEASFAQRLARWLLMAAAILQAVKLFACRGLPWTQAFGVLYLMSYLSVELLNQLGRPTETDSSLETEFPPGKAPEVNAPAEGEVSYRADRRVMVFPAGLQIVLWASILSNFAPQLDMDNLIGANLPTWYLCLAVPSTFFLAICYTSSMMMVIVMPVVISVIAGELAILFLPSLSILYLLYLALDKWFRKQLTTLAEVFDVEVKTMCSTIGVASASVMIYWQHKLLGMGYALYLALISGLLERAVNLQERWNPKVTFLVMSKWAGAGLVLSAATIVSMVGYKLLFVGRLSSFFGLAKYHDGTGRPWACTFLFCTNLITALLYYGLVYDSSGTYQPNWANNLG